jgi:hypothetical protein
MTTKPDDGGAAVLVSDQDRAFFLAHGWRIGQNGYVYIRGGRIAGKPCLLHRIIMNALVGEEIHHINGNKLDNRRENLERTTASEHQKHHVHTLITRSREARVLPLTKFCLWCQSEFTPDVNHRGTKKCCSRKCASQLTVIGALKKRGLFDRVAVRLAERTKRFGGK